MLALPLTLLALLAVAASAPAAPSTPPADAIDAADASDAADVADANDATAPTAPPTPAVESETSPAAATAGAGASSPLQLTFEALSQEEAPEGELGAGEEMEGAENIVFKPLFRYRERGGFRRRVRRDANRRRDTNHRRTNAARFPHHRYRSSPKRRNALRHTNQILF